VPALALKTLFDQRLQLDEEQELQLEVVRRKYAARIQPLLDRVYSSLSRQLNLSKETLLSQKKLPISLSI
jgi:hypothetical protein